VEKYSVITSGTIIQANSRMTEGDIATRPSAVVWVVAMGAPLEKRELLECGAEGPPGAPVAGRSPSQATAT
jgi:hypothetical protein